MEDNKDKELQPKKRGRKPKVENKVDENQTMDFMNMMTPEMMQMFMKFMESQQKTEVMATAVEEEKPIKWNKSMLNKIKDEMVDVRSVIDGRVVKYFSVLPRIEIKLRYINCIYTKQQYNKAISRKDYDNSDLFYLDNKGGLINGKFSNDGV